jgi:hypothetical protein
MQAKGFVLDRGDRNYANVQRMAIQRVGRGHERWPLLVEPKQADLASPGEPTGRSTASAMGHQSRAKDSIVADSNARRSVRSAGASP